MTSLNLLINYISVSPFICLYLLFQLHSTYTLSEGKPEKSHSHDIRAQIDTWGRFLNQCGKQQQVTSNRMFKNLSPRWDLLWEIQIHLVVAPWASCHSWCICYHLLAPVVTAPSFSTHERRDEGCACLLLLHKYFPSLTRPYPSCPLWHVEKRTPARQEYPPQYADSPRLLTWLSMSGLRR